MRKLIAISLTSLLLVSTVGITVHKHYCESILVATSILPHGDGDACDTEMPMSDDDCTDNHQHYSVDSPLVLSTVAFNMSPSLEWVEAQKTLLSFVTYTEFSTSKFYADLSPPPSEPNIYTKVQSFLL